MKTKKEVLASFMKSNKEARERMALNAGFDNADAFKLHLLRAIKKDDGKRDTTIDEIEEVSKDEPIEVQNALDMVIAFDTTGSMSSYISAVRKKVKEVVINLFKNTKDLRVKIVAFGDYCDMRGPNNFGKAYQTIELTNDQNALIKFIENAQNTGGGDGDEFYELVIRKINQETDWRKDARKSVLLIADADPHQVGYSYGQVCKNNQINWKMEAKEAADLGINWDTFTIVTYSEAWYKELSKMTGGVSLPFSSAGNTSDVIEGLAYKRSGATSAYYAKTMAMDATGDEELIGTFKTISTID